MAICRRRTPHRRKIGEVANRGPLGAATYLGAGAIVLSGQLVSVDPWRPSGLDPHVYQGVTSQEQHLFFFLNRPAPPKEEGNETDPVGILRKTKQTWFYRDQALDQLEDPRAPISIPLRGYSHQGGASGTPQGQGDCYTPYVHPSLLSNGPVAAQVSPLAVKGRSESYSLGNDQVSEVPLPGQ